MATVLKYENGKFIQVNQDQLNSKTKETAPNTGNRIVRLLKEKKWNDRLTVFADLMNTIISLAVAIQLTWLLIQP
jgi:hypothetical protein